jgi:acetyl-CoA C-acetyltransferase
MFSQFMGAELMAKTYKLNRAELDQLAYSSHVKAANAIKNGYFNKEIVALKGHGNTLTMIIISLQLSYL